MPSGGFLRTHKNITNFLNISRLYACGIKYYYYLCNTNKEETIILTIKTLRQ